MSCPPRRFLRRLFDSLVDSLPAEPLAESLVSFTCRRLGHRAGHCYACFYPLSTSYPPHRFLRHLVYSLVDSLPATLLTVSVGCFSCRHPARHAACCVACFIASSTACPPRCSWNHLVLSLVDILAAAPLTAKLVSITCSHRFQRRSFYSLVDSLPPAPLPESLVSITCRHLACRVAHCITCLFHLSTSCPPRR
jgi:hypothetical protein